MAGKEFKITSLETLNEIKYSFKSLLLLIRSIVSLLDLFKRALSYFKLIKFGLSSIFKILL